MNPDAATLHLTNTDAPWRDCAERAVRQLAAEGREFTSDDLTDMGVTDPDHSCRWGSLFAAMKQAGVIRKVGYATSSRPGRNGGIRAVWTGTTN